MAPHPIDVHVGKRLRLKRTVLGLSQEAIGNAIGVTFQQIQKYERGINRMGASRIYDFARALGVPVAFFFEGFEDAPAGGGKHQHNMGMAEEQSQFMHEQLSSRETLEMMRAYYRIKDPSVRKRVFELLKAVADSEEEKTGKS